MKRPFKILFSLAFVASSVGSLFAQSTSPNSSPAPSVQQRPSSKFNLAEYGVDLQPDSRLIIMMAALEAAGLEAAPGREPSAFRAQVRRDLAELDPDLRGRLRTFYERNKLPAPATAADQATRYISLALAFTQPPLFEAPAPSDDLPGGLLEVLDFAPLVREFYRKSGIDERLVTYTRAYQAEGDRLRPPAADMVNAVLSYLHTRPITISNERVVSKSPGKKDTKKTSYSVRSRERRFFIVPDLLAVPGSIQLRVIGDDYYAVLPEGTNPQSSELQRAYLQYVIDPIILRFNQSIAERREQIRQVIAEREKAGGTVSPDVFLVVSRSLVSAADARFEEMKRIQAVSRDARQRLDQTKDETEKAKIGRAAQEEMNGIRDETVAKLADDYERGAVLSFMFADALKGIESSGFDFSNFFVDIITSFDPARESKRPAEYAEARQRAIAARQARIAARKAEADSPAYSAAETARAATLVKQLSEVEGLLKLKDYPAAETRLKELIKDNPREPRIFFALAQTASLAAVDATDEEVQAERLNRALANYRLAVQAASPETDRGLMSRAHEAMGRIHSFLENPVEAAKEFDEAIKIGEVRGGAYKEAVENRKKLGQP